MWPRTISIAGCMVLLYSLSALAQVDWVPKLDQALRLAEDQKKLVVVDVTASWCPPCRKMDQEVYPNPEFIEFSKKQVFMRLDADDDPEGRKVAARYDVRSYPTLLVLNARGEEIQRLTGGRSVRQLIEDLTAIFDDPEPLKQFIERAKSDTGNFRLQYRAGERCLDQRDLSRAIQFLKRAAGLSSGQPLKDRVGMHLSLSDAYFRDGKFADALKSQEELEKIDASFSSSNSFRLRKARMLTALKRHEEASRLIHEALKLSRSGSDKSAARELMAKLPGKYRQADQETSKALEKAQSLAKSKKFDEALELARQAVDRAPWAADGQMLVSALYFSASAGKTEPAKRSEDLSAGLLHLRLARQLDPDNLHYYQQSKHRLALRHLPLSPANSDAQKQFAKAEEFFLREQYREALESYKKTIELEPSFGKAYLHMGDCFFAGQRFEDALKCYQIALSKTPLDASAHRFTADALQKLGRSQEAKNYVYSCLLADPEYPMAWKLLESLASSNGTELSRHNQFIPIQFLNLSQVREASDPSLFESVPEATVPAWQEYVKAKTLWRQELFKKRFPAATFYHGSFQEEQDCLKKLVSKWSAMKDDTAGLEDEALDFFLDLDEEGELDTFIFLELFTEEYRGEFEQWKKENAGKAEAYVNRFLLGTSAARRPSAAQGPSHSKPPAADLFSEAYEKAQSGALQEAIGLYRKVLDLEPKRPEALQNLTLLLLKTGDRAAARQALEQWTRAVPESAMALTVYAQLEVQSGNIEHGRELLGKAIEIERDPALKERYRDTLSRLEVGAPLQTKSEPQSELDSV
jgi:tetratricopeptide (TPR) repeat protein